MIWNSQKVLCSLAYIFRDLESSEAVCVWRIWSWVERWSKGGVVVRDRDVDCIGDDKTEEPESGIGGCDCHGLVLDGFLE